MEAFSDKVKLRDPPKHYRSNVWKHFGFRGESKDVATCRICFTDINCKTGNTSNMNAHLNRKHGVNVMVSVSTTETAKATTSTCTTKSSSGQLRLTDVFTPKLSLNATRSQSISKAIAGYLARDMRPLSTVQNEGFKHMVKVLEPRYPLPSRTYFTETVIPQLHQTVTDRVKGALQKAENIALTTDSWTSRATENYVAVTAHFINKNWEVENYTLETKQFGESHTSENLANGLKETVNRWKLTRNGKSPAIATDNASNIVRAVIESGLNPHIPCFAHTLNLATQRGLKVSQVDRLLGRVRRVISFFHKSTSATSSLSLMQTKLDLPKHRLIIDVPTRWNSSFDMLERYLEQQAAVYAALIDVKKNVKDLVTLSDDDVHNIEEVIKILKPLKTVTTMMCSQKHPTVSLIHPLKEMLLRQLEPQPNDNTLVSDVETAIGSDLRPRYTEPTMLKFLLQASALDPRFKSLPYLDDSTRLDVFHMIAMQAVDESNSQQLHDVTLKIEPDENKLPTVNGLPLVPDTHELPSLPAAPPTLGGDPQPPEVLAAPEATDGEPPVKIKKETDCSSPLSDLFGDVFVVKVEPAQSVFDQAESEIKIYKCEATLQLDSDPLVWWRDMCVKFPILSKMAKRCLGVPATSVASERVFSTAGDIVTAQRACLSGENVDRLIFLTKNMVIPDDVV